MSVSGSQPFLPTELKPIVSKTLEEPNITMKEKKKKMTSELMKIIYIFG